MWVENSYLPESWILTENNAITGIPRNNWSLRLNKGNCLDFVPLEENKMVIRNYGFTDVFKGSRLDPATSFMEISLTEWLDTRGLTGIFGHLPEEKDIQELPLFPVVEKERAEAGFIQWLLDENPEPDVDYAQFWKNTLRLSADEISEKSSLSKLEEQRRKFHLSNIPLLAENYRNSVFYQLDLRQLSGEYVENNLDLPLVFHEDMPEWLPIHDNMFRAAYLRKKGQKFGKYEKKAFDYLKEKVLEDFLPHKVEPRIQLLPDQIAWGRSPVRIDLAGGWTDTPPYCMLYGGKVVNLAAELNGQPPLHCYVKNTPERKIVLRSIDLGAQETVTTFDELKSFYNIGSAFSIPKAALALAGFIPEFSAKKYPSLQKQLEETGGGLEISILAAVPKGSGLGTSSILAATVLGTLSEVCNLNWDKMETGKRVLAIEQLLTTGGGWQDQYGGLLEGIKYLETEPGKKQEPKVKWLPDNLFTDPVHKNKMLLYYTGITRVAKNILGEIVRGMFLNSAEHLAVLDELKQHAEQTWENMLKKDYLELGHQVHKSWLLNQKLDAGTNTPEIQQIIDKIHPYIIGQKLPGAGGGGFMLMLAKDEQAAIRIKQLLTEEPVNNRARFVDFEISQSGLQVTKS
ncbi:MAG: bifunctional fucokinase/fucose-1-phosphate guanylyltransferase [Prolixibacteraceae bacterium]